MNQDEPVLSKLANVAAGEVPPEVIVGIPARILDIVGIAVRATTLDTSRAATEFAVDQGTNQQATAIGAGVRLSAAEAAFVNGVLAHSLDYDDTHLPSILHPSAPVVPAALAMAQWRDSSGSELLAAVAVGLEIAVRLGMGGYDVEGRQSIYFERGQHATSICGAVGAAAAASRLIDRSPELAQHAMGIACSMASGIIEANRAGGTVKRLHCGWAARAGVTAAQLAARGITGPPTAIEGRFGLYEAFLGDRANVAITVAGLGEEWEAARIFYKPYPANHFTHTAIDAAMALRADGLHVDEVSSATLHVAPPTVRTIGDPIETKRRPETGYQAQFSGPYAVAAGLFGGGGLGVGLADFTDELARAEDRRAVMARVSVAGDESLLDIYPNQFPARLEVETRSGERLYKEVLSNRGGSERPLTDGELAAKFADNVVGLIGDEARDRLVTDFHGLDATESTRDILAGLESISPVS
ncbi:MAG: MmgE/PrpD family protein [Acidimicrobiales bacterium]